MRIEEAIQKLGNDFPHLNWAFVSETIRESDEVMSYWPGEPDEDVLVCVLKARHVNEVFHRQDFFFLHYAYRRVCDSRGVGGGYCDRRRFDPKKRLFQGISFGAGGG